MNYQFLITGVAGFIGFHLSQRLLVDGHHVIGIDNLNDYYDVRLKEDRLKILNESSGFKFFKGDLTDEDFVKRIFVDFGPQYVINLAAQAGVRYSIENPRAYIDSNIVGFFNILEACRHHPVEHLVFASSSSVYGNRDGAPFKTSDMVDCPASLYAATKKADELMAYTYSHLYKIPTTGLRFFTVYGPWGRPDMAYFKFANLIMNDKPIQIYNNGDLFRDFTYIDDIVEGLTKILPHVPEINTDGARYKLYNIGGSRPVKLIDFIETLEKALHRTAKKEFLPMQPGDVYMTCADASELDRDFGFRPKTLIEDGLPKFVQWYKDYYEMNA